MPVKFLFSLEAGESALSVGLLMIAAAVGAGLLLVPKPSAVRSVASATIGISVLYSVQLQRLLSTAPDGPGLFSVLGFGVDVTLVGAVLLMLNVPLGGRR